tara:strand:+ start:296 stop:571 length:276 start_codon:yes stop_codon:yes gene_type:complete
MMEGATADGGGLLTLCVTFCELWLVELFVFTFCEVLLLVLKFWLFVVTSELDVETLLLLFVETLVELLVFKLVFSDVELLVISEVLLTFCV